MKTRSRIFMDEEIKFDYFEWLVDWVDGKDHLTLLRHLHRRPFDVDESDSDYNRIEDGKALRDKFIFETSYVELNYPDDDCSVLEFLIGVAKRMSDMVVAIEEEDATRDCFWEIISNLGLDIFTGVDMFEAGGSKGIDKIVDRLIFREYSRNGDGGMFPLKNASKDQREVEVWYQMNEYLDQNHSID